MWTYKSTQEELTKSTEVWDPETDETVAEAFARFSEGLTMIPDDVAPDLVPALMTAGIEVWSFGYGDDTSEFTTLDTEAPDEDEMEDWSDGTNMEVWGPFGIDERSLTNEQLVRFGAQYLDDTSMSPFLPDIIDGLLVASATAIRVVTGYMRSPTKTEYLGIASVKE